MIAVFGGILERIADLAVATPASVRRTETAAADRFGAVGFAQRGIRERHGVVIRTTP